VSSTSDNPLRLRNIRLFILLRMLFYTRFYYPVFTVLFLDYGLSLEQFAALNAIWAATIVLAEVPSGALADVVGRKRVLLASACCMVAEMAVIGFAPAGSGSMVFWAFAINRVLSGLAEALVSGADEALAYDSLKAAGLEKGWPRVLEAQMRIRSIGYVAAMLLGAALYDADLVNWVLARTGVALRIGQDTSMRLPVWLTLGNALLAVAVVLGLEETKRAPDGRRFRRALGEGAALIRQACAWIAATPRALAVVLFGLCLDHVLRLVVTLNAQYYRMTGFPDASFGFIGSGIAVIGIVVPRGARHLADRSAPDQVLRLLLALATGTLLGLPLLWRHVGLLFMVLAFVVLMLVSFLTSHYLNEITASRWRATVLSCKSLLFNLGYGFVGLVYGLLFSLSRRLAQSPSLLQYGRDTERTAFALSLAWLLPYFLATFGLALLLCRLQRRWQRGITGE